MLIAITAATRTSPRARRCRPSGRCPSVPRPATIASVVIRAPPKPQPKPRSAAESYAGTAVGPLGEHGADRADHHRHRQHPDRPLGRRAARRAGPRAAGTPGTGPSGHHGGRHHGAGADREAGPEQVGAAEQDRVGCDRDRREGVHHVVTRRRGRSSDITADGLVEPDDQGGGDEHRRGRDQQQEARRRRRTRSPGSRRAPARPSRAAGRCRRPCPRVPATPATSMEPRIARPRPGLGGLLAGEHAGDDRDHDVDAGAGSWPRARRCGRPRPAARWRRPSGRSGRRPPPSSAVTRQRHDPQGHAGHGQLRAVADQPDVGADPEGVGGLPVGAGVGQEPADRPRPP